MLLDDYSASGMPMPFSPIGNAITDYILCNNILFEHRNDLRYEFATTSTGTASRAPKSRNSRRTIPLFPKVWDDLMSYRERQREMLSENGVMMSPSTPVFSTPMGFVYEPRTYEDLFKRTLKEAGVSDIKLPLYFLSKVYLVLHVVILRGMKREYFVEVSGVLCYNQNRNTQGGSLCHHTANLLKTLRESEHICASSMSTVSRAVTITAKKAPVPMMTNVEE